MIQIVEYETIKVQVMALARRASFEKKDKIIAQAQLILRKIGKAWPTLNRSKRSKLIPVRELFIFMKSKRIVDREALARLHRKL